MDQGSAGPAWRLCPRPLLHFKLATEGLDAEPFAQQHCVQQGQQLALHGVATTSNQVATPPEALLARLGPVQTFPLPAAARASSRWRSLRPAVILKALACPLWLMPGWSLQPKTPWRTTPASPGKTLLWLMAALRQRAGLVRQVDAGLLATAGRQPVQGQQQAGQQAHKWATSGECCKAIPRYSRLRTSGASTACSPCRPRGGTAPGWAASGRGRACPLSCPGALRGAGGPRPTGLAKQSRARVDQT